MKDAEHDGLAAVGGKIRQVREARNLNLHELARLSGISAPALSSIETGKRDLRLTSLLRIAGALRIGAGELLQEPSAPPLAETAAPGGGGYDLDDYR